jgi:hypothetical protein
MSSHDPSIDRGTGARTLLACIVLASAPSAATPASAIDVNDLRGQRYCEIFLGSSRFLPTLVEVYNTIGLNDCPADPWSKITEDGVKRQSGAAVAHLNGPRYWVIDGLRNSTLADPTPKLLGGIAMRKAAVLELGLTDLWDAGKPYRTHDVQRDTTFRFAAGKPIYEITDPRGRAFVMQSYSVQKVPQDEAMLARLGTRLRLPTGWSFRTHVLEEDAHLTPVDQHAVVVQDEFLNTYQLETPGFETAGTR